MMACGAGHDEGGTAAASGVVLGIGYCHGFCIFSTSVALTRQCPPGVRNAGSLPAAIQRVTVDVFTSRRRAASAAEM